MKIEVELRDRATHVNLVTDIDGQHGKIEDRCQHGAGTYGR